jgi:hypothetical protein
MKRRISVPPAIFTNVGKRWYVERLHGRTNNKTSKFIVIKQKKQGE